MTKAKLRERLIKRYNKGDQAPLELTTSLDHDLVVPAVTNFVAAHPTFSRKLFDLHGSVPHLGTRLGRGEVLFYFIFNDVVLGGSSSSIDVYHVKPDGTKVPHLEIKCATRSGERYLNFFMGMDEVPASLKFFYRVLKLFEKNDRAGKLLLPSSFAHISKSKLEELKQVSPQAYRAAEDRYLDDLIAGPIGRKIFLIFDRQTMLPVHHGLLTREQLTVERISGGLTRLAFTPS